MGLGNNNSNFSIHAAVTDLGAQFLMENPAKFNITYFSLSDDEIDYSLWNPNHTDGVKSFGKVIENTPILAPVKNHSYQCNYHLINGFPRDAIRGPVLKLDKTTGTLAKGPGEAEEFIRITHELVSPMPLRLTLTNGVDFQMSAKGLVMKKGDTRSTKVPYDGVNYPVVGVVPGDTVVKIETTRVPGDLTKSGIGTRTSVNTMLIIESEHYGVTKYATFEGARNTKGLSS
tara:strand:+ start:34928 stop:35617 length:690 start_codon:yes stop_codon:yes gene_type:complete